MSKFSEKHLRKQLVQHLLTANDETSLHSALDELLTDSEFTDISKRLQILRLLEAGLPQRQIAEQMGVGIATVTRGSRALKAHTNN